MVIDDYELALRNAKEYHAIDTELFGAENVGEFRGIDGVDAEYLDDDFSEVDKFFRDGLTGTNKCPAALMIHLWEERKRLRSAIRERERAQKGGNKHE